MRTASLRHFRSRDVINVIFGKTAVTPSFFKLKTKVKTKLIHGVTTEVITMIRSCKKWAKTSFKNVTMVTKMLPVYISVTVPDRPIVTIIHR